MALVLPRVDNLVPNPSAEVNTTDMSFNGGTGSRVNDWKWVGQWAYKMSTTAAAVQSYIFTPSVTSNPKRMFVDQTKLYSARARVKANAVVANRVFRLNLLCYNAAGTFLASAPTTAYQIAVTSTAEFTIQLPATPLPAGTDFIALQVMYNPTTGTLGGSEIWWADGIQVNEGDPEGYVDGSLGAHHFWTGTAHDSPSYREAIPFQQNAGRSGVTRVSAELWLANVTNQMLTDITPAALDGKVTANINNDIHMALSLTMGDTSAITPYTSVVAPFLTLTDQYGVSQREQLGLYICTPAKQSHQEALSTGQIEGRDLTWILANDYTGSTYNVAAGANYISTVISLITAKGLNYNIPASSLTLPAARSFPPDMSKLQIINHLLEGAGYYTLWADRFGILKSQPYFELASAQPALELFSGEGGTVLDTIEQEGVYDSIANKVIVYKENTQGSSIRVTRTNNDPASAVSTVTLGRVITRVIKDADIADTATAQAIARAAIETGSTFTNKLKITTFPLPDRDLHEVYDLAIYNKDGKAIGFGLWRCDGWELGFTLKSAKMTHNVNRLEPYGIDEEIA